MIFCLLNLQFINCLFLSIRFRKIHSVLVGVFLFSLAQPSKLRLQGMKSLFFIGIDEKVKQFAYSSFLENFKVCFSIPLSFGPLPLSGEEKYKYFPLDLCREGGQGEVTNQVLDSFRWIGTKSFRCNSLRMTSDLSS